MLKRIFIYLLLSSCFVITAQTYEVGFTIGGTNFVGDIGRTRFVDFNDVGFGLIAKWNRSERHAFRFSATYLPISDDDLDSGKSRREFRGTNGFRFKNSIKEFSLGIEFTFWEWNLHQGDQQLTPYLYTGITVINHGDLARTPSEDPPVEIKSFGNDWNMAIPAVFGVKASLFSKLVVGFEVGARYTFTDNLDGSEPVNLNLPSRPNSVPLDLSFGNENKKDWYFYNALTLTYTFGRKPCYCKF